MSEKLKNMAQEAFDKLTPEEKKSVKDIKVHKLNETVVIVFEQKKLPEWKVRQNAVESMISYFKVGHAVKYGIFPNSNYGTVISLGEMCEIKNARTGEIEKVKIDDLDKQSLKQKVSSCCGAKVGMPIYAARMLNYSAPEECFGCSKQNPHTVDMPESNQFHPTAITANIIFGRTKTYQDGWDDYEKEKHIGKWERYNPNLSDWSDEYQNGWYEAEEHFYPTKYRKGFEPKETQ